MIEFSSGEKLNPTSRCYNQYGQLVYAVHIKLGEDAWTAGFGSPLGKRTA